MPWKPDVTVAAVIERDAHFLLIEEQIGDRVVINQPAGHLELHETFIAAATRETLEETAWSFQPEAVTGIYLWPHPERNLSFLRVAFTGQLLQHHAERQLDRGIRRTLWMNRAEVAQQATRLRSPMVLQCIDDYLAGMRYPLALLTHMMDPLKTQVKSA